MNNKTIKKRTHCPKQHCLISFGSFIFYIWIESVYFLATPANKNTQKKEQVVKEIDTIVGYHKSRHNRWVWLVVAIVLLVFAVIYWQGRDKTQSLYRYISEPIYKDTLTLTVSASGTLYPIERVDVGTEVSGMIEEVYVDYNDEVKKGQLLAKLDITKYKSDYDRANASLQIAKAQLQSAEAQRYQTQATVKRNTKLREFSKGSLPTQSDWDRDFGNDLISQAQIANANAQISQATHALSATAYNLERTQIYSPIDGTVLVRNVDPGQTIAASFQTPVLFSIAKDLRRMEIQATIDEADIGKIAVGQAVRFGVDAYPDREFNTTIKQVRINSELIDGVVTYKAIMEVENDALLLKPGMSVDAEIITQTIRDVFVIKRAALLFMPVEGKSKGFFSGKRDEAIDVDPKPHIYILKSGIPQKVYLKLLGGNGVMSAVESDALQEGQEVIIGQEKAQ